MLVCARCPKQPLQKRLSTKGYLFECTKCHGRAITFPLQKAIGGESAYRIFFNELRLSTLKGTAACPSCLRAMNEIKMDDGGLYIDSCRSCQITWFDASELEILKDKEFQPKPTEAWSTINRSEAAALLEVSAPKIPTADHSIISFKGPDQLWKIIPGILRLPVEHTNPLASTPWMTWSLIVIMILIHAFLVNPQEDYAIAEFAFFPNDIWRLYGLTWISGIFMHGGWIHLILNSYFLLLFGDNVEDRKPRTTFFLLFILAGIAGALAHALFDPRSDVPLVGASGAISGIMLVYCLQFPKARLAKFFFVTWLSFPAWAFFAFWMLFQIFGFFDQTAGLTMVSYSAHIGGATVGLIYWLSTRQRNSFKLR